MASTKPASLPVRRFSLFWVRLMDLQLFRYCRNGGFRPYSYYFRSHPTLNPHSIISIEPQFDLGEPHSRAARFGVREA
ncbi:MAG: hypothetical protein GPOALKHO_001602 [Sodalis sp.]|nr:MAG: hypothetical protein GPOALKHO_001602 [Sodalis sp.]